MRRFVTFLGYLMLMVIGVPASAGGPADEAAVKSVLLRFQESWNTPDMPHIEDLFTDDADFVVITGKWLKGRDEIVGYHRDLLKGVYRDSHLFVDDITVRFVRDDLAIVHMASGANFTRAQEQFRRTSLSTSTLMKTGGKWRIIAFHNTLTGGPGYGFPPPVQAGHP